MMKIDKLQQDAMDSFIKMAKTKYNDQIEVIITIHDNPDCGLYAKHDNKIEDLPCLVVIKLKSDHWLGLSYQLNSYYFTPEQIL